MFESYHFVPFEIAEVNILSRLKTKPGSRGVKSGKPSNVASSDTVTRGESRVGPSPLRPWGRAEFAIADLLTGPL